MSEIKSAEERIHPMALDDKSVWCNAYFDEVAELRAAYEALQKENAAQAKRIAELEAAPEYQEPENQLDMPLPCDIRIGAGTIKKGSKLSVLVHRMNVLYQLAMKTQLGIGEPANQEPTKDE